MNRENIKIVYDITRYQGMVGTIPVKVKKLNDQAVIPKYASETAAGADLYSTSHTMIQPGTCVKIPTGLAMEIPDGWFGAIFPRSGLATKKGLRLANSVAVIDSDYRGEVLVPLYNDSPYPQEIGEGIRIAQMIIMPCPRISYIEVEELNETDRGSGGFGSTGN